MSSIHKLEKQTEGYKVLNAHLLSALDIANHEKELLEERLELEKRPLKALKIFLKSIDMKILHFFELSPEAIARPIPSHRQINVQQLENKGLNEILVALEEYDKRFSISEARESVPFAKKAMRKPYMIVRGALKKTAKIVKRVVSR